MISPRMPIYFAFAKFYVRTLSSSVSSWISILTALTRFVTMLLACAYNSSYLVWACSFSESIMKRASNRSSK